MTLQKFIYSLGFTGVALLLFGIGLHTLCAHEPFCRWIRLGQICYYAGHISIVVAGVISLFTTKFDSVSR